MARRARSRSSSNIDAIIPYKNPGALIACCAVLLALLCLCSGACRTWLLTVYALDFEWQGLGVFGGVDFPPHHARNLFVLLLLAASSFPIGLRGLRYAESHPQAKGMPHAWIGMIGGLLLGGLLCWGLLATIGRWLMYSWMMAFN